MMQASLIVNGTRYAVSQQGLRIGRAPENDIVLADPNISPHWPPLPTQS